MVTEARPTPLGLAVLSLLHVGPLHPYGLQRLIKLWGKDQVVYVGQRANLYRVINRLHDGGLITVRQTERDQQFPERTVYELSERGRQASLTWLTEMLSTPRNEYPEFPAALSFVMLLPPAESLGVLDQRAARLADQVGQLERELALYAGRLPRVTLLESEYLLAMARAELSWLRSVTDDLRAGTLGWTAEDLVAAAIGEGSLLSAVPPDRPPA